MTDKKAAQREYQRKWREKNRDRLQAYNRAYYAENREHILSTQKEWRRANPEKIKRYERTQQKRAAAKRKAELARIKSAPEIAAFCSTEPRLAQIAYHAARHAGDDYDRRLWAYQTAQWRARYLIGWLAKKKRLRGSAAWDTYMDFIKRELKL